MAQGFKEQKKSLTSPLAKKQNSTFNLCKFMGYSKFLQNSLLFAGGRNPTKNKLMYLCLATAFCQKRKKKRQVDSFDFPCQTSLGRAVK